MVRILVLCSLGLAFAPLAPANPVLVRETDPLTAEQEQAALKVPHGFEIRLFASEPMINKPINLAWDDRGRLWVSSTVEYPYAAKKDRWADPQGSRVRDSRDAIKILEDTDGDGRADRVTDFADGLNIPTGVLPWHQPEHHDGCIAWSIPNIWYFADTTGDGRCDHREVLFGPLGWERDTHGMCSSFRMGHDGWVYATHGFNNTSRLVARDGSTLEMHSGNVFRFRPDGSHVEIWSRGQVNPFGLCFDRRGNLYSADCHSSPVYQLLRGAVYPSFGKPHDGIGFGPVMIQHTHGSTGICGITYLDRDVWGPKWNDRVLIGNPVTSRVNHDRIQFAGSTPVAVEQPDFVTSDDPWFRPVDLCLGGDGALYIADFYNRIIGHYEVPLDHPGRDRERGRIWRVAPTAGTHPGKAMELPALSSSPAGDLRSPSPFVRRAAAAHLQQEPDLAALPALLELLAATPAEDTHLRHGVRMAIREHLRLPGAFRIEQASSLPLDLALAVPSAEASVFLASALESDRQPDPDLREQVLSHLAQHGSPEALHKAVALERARSDRSPLAQVTALDALATGLEERGGSRFDPELLSWARDLAEELLQEPEREEWIAAPHPSSPKDVAPWGLQSRRCSDGKETTTLSSLAGGGERIEQRTGILRSKSFPAPASISFWICGHRGFPEDPAHDKNLVQLVATETGEVLHRAFPPRNDICREVTWDLSARKSTPVHLELVDGDQGNAYAWLGVARIAPAVVSVDSFQGSNHRPGALRTLASLLKTSAPVDLRDRLKPYLPPAPAAAPLPVSPEERARLDTLIRERTASFATATPNVTNGKAQFQTHCASCHQVGGEGALLGPQLDGIGSRGVARLCEDILDPNRNVDAHFYLTTLSLQGGTSAAGFIRSESAAVIQLVDVAGNAQRIPTAEVKERKILPMSLMPPTFGQALPEAAFHDLIGWLLQQ